MRDLAQEFRHAVRAMAAAPAFTFAAVLTIALAVGATTTVFSVVYGVLLRPLPYPEPDGIVRLSESHPGGTSSLRAPLLSDVTYRALEGVQAFEDLAAYSSREFTMTGTDEPERITGASAGPSLFDLLRVRPAVGRFFTEEEAVEGGAAVVILSHAMWQRRFGGSRDVLGRTITLDGRPHEIVGVAPEWFYFPSRDAQLWTPYVMPGRPTDPNQNSIHIMSVLARLRSGVTIPQAEAEATAAARSVVRPAVSTMLFGQGGPVEVNVDRLVDSMTASVRPAMLVLSGAVLLVLLVACANVANLLLARGLARSRELAVRAALGAGRGRIFRHLLAESLTVVGAGGLLGIMLSWVLTRALPAWAPERFPRLDDVKVDPGVLGFAVLVTFVAGVLSGGLPALRGTRSDLVPALRSDDIHAAGGGGERLRAVLLAFEAAIGVVLLVGATLLGRSFVTLVNVDPGYDPRNVLYGRVYLTGASAAPERSKEIMSQLAERLRSMPEVESAGAGNMAPLSGSTAIAGFRLHPNPDPARALQYIVTPGYAEALGLRLREGRFLRPEDVGAPIQALVVNEAFVRAYLNDGQPAVGRRYPGLMTTPERFTEIVGVVDNVLKDGLDRNPEPEIYLVAAGEGRGIPRDINLLIRTKGDPIAFVPALRSIVRQIDPQAALAQVGPLEARIAQSVAQPRFAAAVLATFAGLGLVLAATGLYGGMSYNVSRRRREMGIRLALGAARRQVIGLVLRRGLTVTSVGLIAGVLGAIMAAGAIRPLLFGISALDPISFAIAALVLLSVAALACVMPARRAASVDPAEALRAE